MFTLVSSAYTDGRVTAVYARVFLDLYRVARITSEKYVDDDFVQSEAIRCWVHDKIFHFEIFQNFMIFFKYFRLIFEICRVTFTLHY